MNDLFEINSSKRITFDALEHLLPSIEVTLFFAKVYNLSAEQLSTLLLRLHRTPLVDALLSGTHSTELQDYIIDVAPPEVYPEVKFDTVEAPPASELMVQLWEEALIEVADSIQQVADKLVGTLHLLPSKEGSMVFQSMRVMNAKRPTIGDYRAKIHHRAVPDVAVVLDVSGSMTAETIRTIIDDVVALSWKANAHLFIVSNTTTHWEPGAYDVPTVLRRAEYGGTHYETLAPAFNRAWGTVITIADYDSSNSAKRWIRDNCPAGQIDQLFDISLVNRPTFLGECLGQLASNVKPLLVARGDLTRANRYW